jgi:hypothetical protein
LPNESLSEWRRRGASIVLNRGRRFPPESQTFPNRHHTVLMRAAHQQQAILREWAALSIDFFLLQHRTTFCVH